ncbi:group II intron reverse transcriptase/maturase [Paenibacillus melissococcoides]|uniref:Group II intron reverse transcriptase/maturase n=1 Tax=Paenibacillus melissococcoides TaxID=2912268 RepID=A0ABN8U3Q7_9BACL|nr:group II intron reverse transcriptase/maturase [Paenibacillus melissococcoides]CAH8245500.1 group II intron reverse transcriptase/maturase [Paenibacillus melissococcoides]CAH8711129.1 group II intron reverse transcriptase/maturase [Paenibacillus melissococcoides]CAH8711896.1 group II intron reverse transcriptase/maturase [Paenibacillus melissococcoides]
MQALRYWDYYNLTDTFTDLHEQAKQGKTFKRLYELITSRENILLAYRTIKSNKGSKTAGTDGKTIENLKTMTDSDLVNLVKTKLKNYQPKKVRRVFIPKPNGRKRPLGIPCILDRLIQQCFKQVLEPIAEAHFYKHSYGFRPLRSTHNALARVQFLINNGGLHFIVDIDIKGFFDNINHSTLLKQIWNLGIHDRKVLRIISRMLKAVIEGEGTPVKGTPQGGILSPLLSNIALHDLDTWVAGQWENFQTKHAYTKRNKYNALKKSKLKEGFIVRYSDDFKILCRDWKTAQKWFHAVKLYLKDRLKLDISPEKSKILNLRKQKSEFLGFTIKATMKGKKAVAHTGVIEKKKQQIKIQYKKLIQHIQQSPSAGNVHKFNSFVLGIHNYFRKATHVFIEFSRLAYDLKKFTYNRLKRAGKYEHPDNPPPTYRKFYSTSYRTFKVDGVYLYPIVDVTTSNNLNFSQEITPFTVEGRKRITRKLVGFVQSEIIILMKSDNPQRSAEYLDNRISRYSMVMGKCEITGIFLYADDVHCHHYLPTYLGGDDSYNNLRILHQDVHTLIHATNQETIMKLINMLGLTGSMIKKVNQYRKMSNLGTVV